VDVQTFDVMPDISYEMLEMYVNEHNAQSTYYEFIISAILCLKLEEYIGHKYRISSWYILLVMNQILYIHFAITMFMLAFESECGKIIWTNPGQTGAHPASFMTVTGSFLALKWLGHGVNHPPSI
jgi:hypothetical protein